ncbi:putative RNA-directed DNA polymerase from transposon X-element [Trichonephila clavipes]|nr:putative RNA-directed DNA polymerase from transposon X-element [Trichonephila clavipes]
MILPHYGSPHGTHKPLEPLSRNLRISSRIGNPYVILVQETQLLPFDQGVILNYSLYRSDHTKLRGGGTAIFIKRIISHRQLLIQNRAFENTAIVLDRQNDKPITTVSVYRPLKVKIDDEDLHQFFRKTDCCFVIGDFNAKHHYRNPQSRQNPEGRTIYKFCNRIGISVHAPASPTRFYANGANSTLDNALAKKLHSMPMKSISELTSDHNPMNFDICLNNFTVPPFSSFSFPNRALRVYHRKPHHLKHG